MCSRVSWTFGLGHDEHAHPLTSGTGCSFSIRTPADAQEHGETENIYGTLVVTYTDAGHGDIPPAQGEATLLLNPKTQEAEWADRLEGVEVVDDASASGLRKVVSFDEGDHIAYDPANLVGVDSVIAQAQGKGTIQLRWGAADAEPFAELAFGGGEGWQQAAATLANAPEGSDSLYVTSTGGVDLDYLRFVGAGVGTGAVPDTLAPVVRATLDPAQPTGENGWYTADVTVSVTAVDDGTVTERAYSLDGGKTWQPVSTYGTFAIAGDGEHTALVRATDGAGNVSEPVALSVRIDAAAPVVSVSGVEDGAMLGDSGVLRPEAAAEDATSGVVATTLTVDGTPVTEALELWTLDLGEHTLVATATDAAGNTAETAVTFTTTTSLADVRALLGLLAERGEVGHTQPLVAQLDQADRHLAAGRTTQGVAALQRFADKAGHDVLVRDAQAVIASLS